MGDSQSRYSIVERLTTKKLEIMASRAKLKEKVRSSEQNIDRLGKDLENWKKDVLEDTKREQRMKEVEVENAVQDFENAKERAKDRDKVYEDQIKAVGEALLSIEEISKTAPTVQS